MKVLNLKLHPSGISGRVIIQRYSQLAMALAISVDVTTDK
ncbi:conserved protein of unknown function [Moritella yayanosii]|uniref:Uncharacterized protein n=1 Tax=Moritella yayanosii TaxID=69539 RepID=A0A330LSP0_9GAMM|nr:conserved protein of unknown function [Moritella yayanosii]